MPATKPQDAKRRHFITLNLPPEHVAWLDAQAAATDRSRSAFVRVLIARAMAAPSDTATA